MNKKENHDMLTDRDLSVLRDALSEHSTGCLRPHSGSTLLYVPNTLAGTWDGLVQMGYAEQKPMAAWAQSSVLCFTITDAGRRAVEEGVKEEPETAGGLTKEKPEAGFKVEPPHVRLAPRELGADPLLRYFSYDHLPPALQETARPFYALAAFTVRNIPRNPERRVALRKLLEAKDAAVRASLPG